MYRILLELGFCKKATNDPKDVMYNMDKKFKKHKLKENKLESERKMFLYCFSECIICNAVHNQVFISDNQ